MRRRAAKVDDNQPQIVAAFRSLGCSVTPTHAAGAGFPDLCVGDRGRTYLVEVKDGSLVPSRRKLTPAQVEWHAAWRGHVTIVETVQDVMKEVKQWRE